MRAAAPCAGLQPQQQARPCIRRAVPSLTARARPPALISSGGGMFGVGGKANLSSSSSSVAPCRPSSSALLLRCRASRSSARDGRAAPTPTIEPMVAVKEAPALRDDADAVVAADAADRSPTAPSPASTLALAAAPSAAALALTMAALPGVTGFSLAGPWSTIQALSVLAAVIAVHEAGHFAAARSLGVLVSRFCIGFGPTLVSWRAGAGDEDADQQEEEQSVAAAEPPAAAAAFRWPWQQQETAPPPPPPPPPPQPAAPEKPQNPLTYTLALLARLRAALSGDADAFLAATPQTPPAPEKKAVAPKKPWPRGSVEYALCALPLGGYVAFPEPEDAAARERQAQQQQRQEEEDEESLDRRPEPTYAPDDPDLLANRPVPQRLLVASAGVAFNCAFALLTLLAQMLVVGKAEYDYLPGVKVPDVTKGGAAEAAGLKAGDTIVRVGKAELSTGPGQVAAAVAQIKASTPGQPLEVVVLVEDGDSLPSAPALKAEGATTNLKTKTLVVVPRAGPRPPPASTPEEQMALPLDPPSSQIGVSLVANTFVRHTKPDSFLQALAWAWQEFCRLGGSVLSGLKSIVTDFATASQQLSGPVAIVAAGSEIARSDAAGLYQFCAVVNINLAAVNALPLPGLDGGFAALLMVEAVRGGKRVSKGLEAGVMAGGLALLTLMGVALIVRDTARLLL
jgi:membrane-associated protease RseP (regulator of RpoE activity)